jgi:hypothetical protein
MKVSCVFTLVRVAWFGGCLSIAVASLAQAQTPARYSATFASINTHPPAPEWFKDAKFGIYFHWGAFGTAQYGYEWYPRVMYDTTSDIYRHHLATFGDPLGDWPYDKFITGANDKSGNFTPQAERHPEPDRLGRLVVRLVDDDDAVRRRHPHRQPEVHHQLVAPAGSEIQDRRSGSSTYVSGSTPV